MVKGMCSFSNLEVSVSCRRLTRMVVWSWKLEVRRDMVCAVKPWEWVDMMERERKTLLLMVLATNRKWAFCSISSYASSIICDIDYYTVTPIHHHSNIHYQSNNLPPRYTNLPSISNLHSSNVENSVYCPTKFGDYFIMLGGCCFKLLSCITILRM